MQDDMEKINEMAIKLYDIAKQAYEEIDVESKEQCRMLTEMMILSRQIMKTSEIALECPF